MEANRLRPVCWALTVALSAWGCRTAPTSPPPALAPSPSIHVEPAAPDLDISQRTPARTTPAARRIAGESVEGRLIPYSVHGIGPDTVLLLSTIHGDEAAGTPLLQRLADMLTQHPALTVSTRVVIVPVLNPDGLAANRRSNAHSVDLNRNFPATNRSQRSNSGRAPLSEPESTALFELIEHYQPQRIVSIHGWVGLVDWDGPAREWAQAVAGHCGLPARQIGSRPGSLGSFMGVDRHTPVLTLELPSRARTLNAQELWEAFGEALLECIRWTPDHSS